MSELKDNDNRVFVDAPVSYLRSLDARLAALEEPAKTIRINATLDVVLRRLRSIEERLTALERPVEPEPTITSPVARAIAIIDARLTALGYPKPESAKPEPAVPIEPVLTLPEAWVILQYDWELGSNPILFRSFDAATDYAESQEKVDGCKYFVRRLITGQSSPTQEKTPS